MQPNFIDAKDRLIVALDLEDVRAGERMVAELDNSVTFYKIGLTLQLATGVGKFIEDLINAKKKVFLDYKYYDIPETLSKAVSRAAGIGVSFLTVHGSSNLIRSAVSARAGSDLKLFTVTVLTSMDEADLAELGYSKTSVEKLVEFRAKMALEAGCDGVIASGHEAEMIKRITNNLLVVTPGIRPDGYPRDDQKRRMSPSEAIGAGADYLVIGRPITDAVNPRREAADITEKMQAAFNSRPHSVSI